MCLFRACWVRLRDNKQHRRTKEQTGHAQGSQPCEASEAGSLFTVGPNLGLERHSRFAAASFKYRKNHILIHNLTWDEYVQLIKCHIYHRHLPLPSCRISAFLFFSGDRESNGRSHAKERRPFPPLSMSHCYATPLHKDLFIQQVCVLRVRVGYNVYLLH